MTHILVVDDEEDARHTIRRVLTAEDYVVTLAGDAFHALDLLEAEQPDLAIVDIIMPEMSGIELVRRIRSDPFHAQLPIIFLTAKSRPYEVAEGLDTGADDYLTKPFEIVELPARIRAVLRRAPGGALSEPVLQRGDLVLHERDFVAEWHGQPIDLTPLEHRLLHTLLMHNGHPVSVDHLLEDVWEYAPGTGDPSVVYVAISAVRQKIDSSIIRSVRGQGYLIPNP